ncbi:MAG: dihydroorotase [Roseibacillus sp.]|jgi:dihydroorotase|nr:dihydroorotase [Roseibacillus sp.]MDP7307487.1 dihydroorotase [Roseibacillus sp.]MDP7496834.1 dihydroorotase [Roseibacillus sp.]MDP7654503.1 dihydroorotase [Roseibacillus sp.]HJM63220.1 dihydroorotase [Roseibacillus sp.]|tara:strand:- start:1785 stop:3059 length:1275 start_codon:yes stop_codon:yes gene_type:complete
MSLLIKGGEIAGEEGAPMRGDVLVEDGVIRAVGQNLEAPEGVREVDADGKIVAPAMFDAHVHFREPGQEHKEDIAHGTEAAINGGVTGVVMMPNTNPVIDSAAVVGTVLDKARQVSRIPVYTSGCITKGRAGEELAGIDGMRNLGVMMLTDDGDPVANPAVLKNAMEYATPFGMFFASHCEVPELSGPRALNEGKVSYQLGIKGSPACSEEICMDRDIRLAYATGAHVHIQHVSSAIGMETVRWWKERGARVTAEVTPHHLIFNEEDIGEYDTNYKMNPPLRTREDNAALLEGLQEGVFDLIATDHAPHGEFEKGQDFVSAPNGITGLEMALVSLHDRFIVAGKFGWDLIVKRYSAEPRRLMGLDPAAVEEGKPAELLVFDPAGETTFSRDFMRSKGVNTPFLDQTLKGRVDLVVRGSEVLLER